MFTDVLDCDTSSFGFVLIATSYLFFFLTTLFFVFFFFD